MRTTRRSQFALLPLLQSYGQHQLCDLNSIAKMPGIGPRVDAVLRARAVWCNNEFVLTSSDADLQRCLRAFYGAVSPIPLFAESMARNLDRIRAGLTHLLESRDGMPLRLNRCLADSGAFAIPALGPTFWSAVAQALDPLRHPSWTPHTFLGARRLGLVRRRRIWYGDLMMACDEIRERDPRMTAIHVDHFLTLASVCRGPDLSRISLPADPMLAAIADERSERPPDRTVRDHAARIATARHGLQAALSLEDGSAAIAALESLDCRLSMSARAWDSGALLQWIAWIWNDDDPLSEVAACERESAGASRCLTSAVLHLRFPDRFPLWDRLAAAGLERISDQSADDYAHYTEAVIALGNRYGLDLCEVPGVLARLSRPGAH